MINVLKWVVSAALMLTAPIRFVPVLVLVGVGMALEDFHRMLWGKESGGRTGAGR